MASPVHDLPVDGEFALQFGALLRSVRRERGMRIRHLADGSLPARSLRAAEAGELELEPVTVTRLAMRYGVELGDLLDSTATRAVVVGDGTLWLGDAVVGFVPGDEWSLLQGYLEAVRNLRSLSNDELVALRRDDIDVLAGYLDMPGLAVVDHLGVLMGAADEDRLAMCSLYLAHASVIGCTSPN